MKKYCSRILWFKPIDGSSLVVFRICFGAIMFWEVFRYWPLIKERYIAPKMLFPYEFLSFVRPWPEMGMHLHFAMLALAALGMMLGCFYRMSALIFCLGFTYIFLLDKTHYLNHWYLICLISFLMIWLSAHREISFDTWRRHGVSSEGVPSWNVFLLQAQLVIVYFYAGVAKLNADWFRGEPVRQWLQADVNSKLVQGLGKQEWFVYGLCYGGLIFDLSIGFLVWFQRTRWLAIPLLLFFHVLNAWVFRIGIFPWLMIASTVLFLEPPLVRQWLIKLFELKPNSARRAGGAENVSQHLRRWVPRLIVAYLLVQIAVPLRHWLYPGSVHWTEEGHRFSWHMKLREKAASFSARIIDPSSQREFMASLKADLTERQIRKMPTRPDMIWQYAQYLRRKFENQVTHPVVRVEVWASLNGRPMQLLIDPSVDLGRVPYPPFSTAPWIVPLNEQPLR